MRRIIFFIPNLLLANINALQNPIIIIILWWTIHNTHHGTTKRSHILAKNKSIRNISTKCIISLYVSCRITQTDLLLSPPHYPAYTLSITISVSHRICFSRHDAHTVQLDLFSLLYSWRVGYSYFKFDLDGFENNLEIWITPTSLTLSISSSVSLWCRCRCKFLTLVKETIW